MIPSSAFCPQLTRKGGGASCLQLADDGRAQEAAHPDPLWPSELVAQSDKAVTNDTIAETINVISLKQSLFVR